MRIVTDKEGAEAVKGLCHLALKTGGIQNHASITKILDSLEVAKAIKQQPPEEPTVPVDPPETPDA